MNEIIFLEFYCLNSALFTPAISATMNPGTQDEELKPTMPFYSEICVLEQTANRMKKHKALFCESRKEVDNGC